MTNLTVDPDDVKVVWIKENWEAVIGETMTPGQYGRLNPTTGKGELGKATTDAEARDGGILVSKDGAGTRGTFMREGILELGAALDALDYDDDVYLSDTDGVLADTPGTVAKRVGTVVPGWAETTPEKLLRVDMSSSPEVPDDSITKAKLAPGTGTKIALINGGAAGNHTVTGIATADELIFIGHISTAASIATLADLTSEFTISAANTINNAAGTDTTNDQLLVFYNDLT